MPSSDGDRTIRVQAVLPEWAQALRPLAGVVGVLVDFAKNPVGFVMSIISLYVVNAIFGLFGIIVGSIQAAFDVFVWAFDGARVMLISAASAVGFDILSAIAGLQMQFADAVSLLGPAAPIVAVGVGSLGVYATYRLVVVAAGELPLGSSIVDVLRLR